MATRYVKVTERGFNLIREYIYSSESKAGAMDDGPAIEAEKAFNAVKRIEVRNSIEPLSFVCESTPVKAAKDKWVSIPEVRASMNKKLDDIRPTFDAMTEKEYGDWIDALEFPEFLELFDICDAAQ